MAVEAIPNSAVGANPEMPVKVDLEKSMVKLHISDSLAKKLQEGTRDVLGPKFPTRDRTAAADGKMDLKVESRSIRDTNEIGFHVVGNNRDPVSLYVNYLEGHNGPKNSSIFIHVGMQLFNLHYTYLRNSSSCLTRLMERLSIEDPNKSSKFAMLQDAKAKIPTYFNKPCKKRFCEEVMRVFAMFTTTGELSTKVIREDPKTGYFDFEFQVRCLDLPMKWMI